MSEVTRLTKAAILNGKDQVFYEHFEELGGELALRPLTEGQFSQVTAVRAAGAELSGNAVMDANGEVDRKATGEKMTIKVDMEKAAKMEFEAEVLAVAFSLSSDKGDTWTDKEVKSLRPVGIVKKIAEKVYAITGAAPKQIEQVKTFRDGERRPGDN
jgi:hypothetical protein